MKRILVVDDQPAVRRFLAEELGDDGYVVQTAAKARDVGDSLQMFQADLVLLDLYLDGPQGWHLFREIKDRHPELSVIIYTAYDSYIEDPALSGADGYVVKSFDLTELRETISGVLQGRETGGPHGNPAAPALTHHPEQGEA